MTLHTVLYPQTHLKGAEGHDILGVARVEDPAGDSSGTVSRKAVAGFLIGALQPQTL